MDTEPVKLPLAIVVVCMPLLLFLCRVGPGVTEASAQPVAPVTGEVAKSPRRIVHMEPLVIVGGPVSSNSPSASADGPPLPALSDVVDPDGDGLVGALNINTASVRELMLLPGLGPKRAAAVLKQRARRRFRRPLSIVRVRGIGAASFRRWKTHLKVRGETTLRRVPKGRG